MQMTRVYLNEALQGRILQTLLDAPATTSQIAQFIRGKIGSVRRELIHLHHLGMIRIVAVRHLSGAPPARSYRQDYLWELTTHTIEHSEIRTSCRACAIRSRRILRAGGLV